MAYVAPSTVTAGTSPITAAAQNIIVNDIIDHETRLLVTDPFAVAWQSYTPTWSNLTVGNGVVTAKYFTIGKSVHYFGAIIWGSTTSATSTTTLVSLPVTAISAAYDIANGSVFYGDSGIRGYVGVCAAQSTTTMIFHHTETGNFGDVNNVAPFTWGANDFIKWSIIYQAA